MWSRARPAALAAAKARMRAGVPFPRRDQDRRPGVVAQLGAQPRAAVLGRGRVEVLVDAVADALAGERVLLGQDAPARARAGDHEVEAPERAHLAARHPQRRQAPVGGREVVVELVVHRGDGGAGQRPAQAVGAEAVGVHDVGLEARQCAREPGGPHQGRGEPARHRAAHRHAQGLEVRRAAAGRLGGQGEDRELVVRGEAADDVVEHVDRAAPVEGGDHVGDAHAHRRLRTRL